VLEKRREAVRGLVTRRATLATVLARCAGATTAARAAVEGSGRPGGAAVRDGLQDALAVLGDE